MYRPRSSRCATHPRVSDRSNCDRSATCTVFSTACPTRVTKFRKGFCAGCTDMRTRRGHAGAREATLRRQVLIGRAAMRDEISEGFLCGMYNPPDLTQSAQFRRCCFAQAPVRSRPNTAEIFPAEICALCPSPDRWTPAQPRVCFVSAAFGFASDGRVGDAATALSVCDVRFCFGRRGWRYQYSRAPLRLRLPQRDHAASYVATSGFFIACAAALFRGVGQNRPGGVVISICLCYDSRK